MGTKFIKEGDNISCSVDTGFNNGGFLNTFYAKIENLKLYLRTTRKAFSNKSNGNDFDTGWVHSAYLVRDNNMVKSEFGYISGSEDIYGLTCRADWYLILASNA